VFRARMVFDDPMLTASVTDDLIALANIVDQHPEVPLQERLRWAFAPVDPQNLRICGCYSRWYQDYVRRRIVALPTEGMRIVEAGSARYDRDLYEAEIESKVLTVYSWLSFRFPEHFPSQAECTDLRSALNDYVERSLTAASRRADRRKMPRRRAQRA